MQDTQRTVLINGESCELTRLESELYRWLCRYRGRVVTREALLKNIWGFPREADTRSVDMCIRRLRRKIGPDAIRTVYGKGYVLTEQTS